MVSGAYDSLGGKNKKYNWQASGEDSQIMTLTSYELYENYQNLLVASWVNNLSYREKTYEEKLQFFTMKRS